MSHTKMGYIDKVLTRVADRLLRRLDRNEKRTKRSPSGLILGLARPVFGAGQWLTAALSVVEELLHICVFGASGGGKSISILGLSLHRLKNGVGQFVLDTHNTIEKFLAVVARKVASGEWSEDVINNICLISPAVRDWTVIFNPIGCPAPELAPEWVARLMKLLTVLWGDIMGAQTIQFTQSTLILAAEYRVPLADIIGLINDTVRLRGLALNMINKRAQEYFLKQYLTWTPQRRAQVAEAFVNKISGLLMDPRLAAMLGSADSDIDLREAMDSGKTVLVDINRGQFFDSVGLVASLMLVSLQHATFSRGDQPENQRRPFHITIEEFPTFAGSVTVEPFLNEARKFGVSLTLVAQTFSAIDKSLLSSLRANCYTQMFFRLSPEDAQVATAGLSGELRNAVAQKLVSLPTGTAIMIQGGKAPQLLKIPNVEIPECLTDAEKAIIERIRRNIGGPLDLSRGATAPESAPIAARISLDIHDAETAAPVEQEYVDGDIA